MQLLVQFKNSFSKAMAVVVLTLSMVSMFISSNVLADTSNSSDHNFSQNSKSYDTKANIKLEQMNSKNKKSEKDNRIGAFSMVDGAMDGYYGDGEYAD